MSDSIGATLKRFAGILADAADVLEVASDMLADMRPGRGEAPGDATLKPSPQVQEEEPSTTKPSTPSLPSPTEPSA